MSIHTEADYSSELAAHKDPVAGGKKVPYHLWGRMIPIHKKGGELGQDLCEMKMIGSHVYPEKVEFCLNQGWKLLKFWLPEPDANGNDQFRESRTLLEMALRGGSVDDLLKQIQELKELTNVLQKKVKKK